MIFSMKVKSYCVYIQQIQSPGKMSFPEYLNKIINSQLKNKQIETVRAQITKLISTNKQKKESSTSQIQDKSKVQEMHKTISNFFNVHSLHRKLQQPLDARKTFSEMHISRLKKRLTLQEENRQEIEVHVPQDATMSQWRMEMLKHLRPALKKPLFQPKSETGIKQISPSQQSRHTILQAKPKLKFNKSAKTASSPILRRLQRKEKGKQQINEDHLHISSQRNIILIRPQPISQEQLQERGMPRFKKGGIKQKRGSKKSESHQDSFKVQRLANFTALLPYLETLKAKVQIRQQKKPKQVLDQIIPQVTDYPYQLKKKKKVPEQVIEISGWDAHHD